MVDDVKDPDKSPLQGVPQLVWTYQQAGYALGGISAKSVIRLADKGEIHRIKIGGNARIDPLSVQDFINRQRIRYNPPCAGGQEATTWQKSTQERTQHTGGHVSKAQARKTLDEALASHKRKNSRKKHN